MPEPSGFTVKTAGLPLPVAKAILEPLGDQAGL
jgi:hypothetical protein